jgi:dihydrofolate reductase
MLLVSTARVPYKSGVAIRQGLDEDVIDDVTISTVPVVIGTGRRLFGGRPQTKTWTLASARSFPSGLVQAHYDRKR